MALPIVRVLFGCLVAVAAARAAPAPKAEAFLELKLEVTLPALEGGTAQRLQESICLGKWTGKLGASDASITLWAMPTSSYGFENADAVQESMADYFRSPEVMGSDARLIETERRHLVGRYGVDPVASIATCVERLQQGTAVDDVAAHVFFCSLLERHGFCIDLRVAPPLPAAELARLAEALAAGVAFSGAAADPDWTDAEVEERWNREAPESARGKAFKKIIRTAHYVVMTNSSSAASFGKKMEENYAKIRKVFPFEEVAGRRLMPIFLFKTADEYYQFCEVAAGWTRQQAAASKGHAYRDYYATWYESPNDPAHIHEATHQIFQNRLLLSGGGSWFQEGVAEYVTESKNDRNAIARLVAEGKATPLREFMELKSLLYSSKVDKKFGSQSGTHYTLAGLLIEFFAQSKLGPEKFQEFVHAVGDVPRSDLRAIEQAIRGVYHVGLDEVEEAFREYCKSGR